MANVELSLNVSQNLQTHNTAHQSVIIFWVNPVLKSSWLVTSL